MGRRGGGLDAVDYMICKEEKRKRATDVFAGALDVVVAQRE
jgi:hypothetical protein